MSSYNLKPALKLDGSCIVGYDNIIELIKKDINYNSNFTLIIDSYPGVDDEEVLNNFLKLNPNLVINMYDIFKIKEELNIFLYPFLGEDRVFGKMFFGEIIDLLDLRKLEEAKNKVKENEGLTIVYGFGAQLVSKGDLLIYADLARWEIQQRYRNKMPNYKCDNYDEDTLKKIKRGFFVEWRIADKHKRRLFDDIDYVLDTNKKNQPKLISGDLFRKGLIEFCNTPFRTVPYFDKGVWGGQWMKEKFDLDPKESNYAWSFDGVLEENSLYFEIEDNIFEFPGINLVLYRPKELLGEKVYSRFGAEFPIRFDLLDTVEGQNLSLQVHPLTDYIYKTFGMNYTQEESYYLLDAKEDASVYLGLKENIDSNEMLKELKEANKGKKQFDAEKYVNKFPAKKHDHFLIPPGTIHCSGKNSVVLEISATPYIFTFKLWDWGRLGLDGKPRPVHIEHGEKVIQWNRDTKWVKENLINNIVKVENDECEEEITGLHDLEFIETRRYWFDKKINHDTRGTLNVLNLVEGDSILVEAINNEFEPYVVNYGETFVVPANVGKYTIKPYGNRSKYGVIKAFVKNSFDKDKS